MVKIFWFRKDLRLYDNRALYHFVNNVQPNDKYIFLYIKNENTYKFYGQKRIAFLYESLTELQKSLEVNKYNLYIFKGNSLDCFKLLISKFSSIEVYANLQFEPYCIKRDSKVRKYLDSKRSVLNLYSDSSLFEPGEITKDNKTPYTIFTPFSRKCQLKLNYTHYAISKYDIEKLNSENNIRPSDSFEFSNEYFKLDKSVLIRGGRKEGLRLLSKFIEKELNNYNINRDFPAKNATSMLSPHLHFGNISIREAYCAALTKSEKAKDINGIKAWINELFWREFYINISYHYPNVYKNSFKEKFDSVKWKNDDFLFDAWREGKTGYPIVDAGMRQLKTEGWMHNRVRMITAMFLTKDLFFDWRQGEKYFAENLIDLDFASNNGGWQWSASTGCDAQPYFRIFNPYLQSKKFDSEGNYIRKYIKELRKVPSKLIHNPDNMSQEEQHKFGIRTGIEYPKPVVDHQKSKEYAINYFSRIGYEI